MNERYPNAGNREWAHDLPKPAELARLGMIGIEIEDAETVRSFDPNSIKVAFLGLDLAGKLKPKADLPSICSGAPAVLYRTEEAEVALTPGEVERLVRRSLTPEEFAAICDVSGILYEMHGCFYDPDTGIAHAD